MIKIKVLEGDITDIEADAIVNASNCYGYMGGGVAGDIKKIGGNEIELQAVSKAPIPIGHAIITTAGSLKARYVIHSPTMEQPGSISGIENIKEALNAALECADENNIDNIAIPGMGCGTGQVPKEKAADAMLEIIINFSPKNIKEVILIDKDKEMIKAWDKKLNSKKKFD